MEPDGVDPFKEHFPLQPDVVFTQGPSESRNPGVVDEFFRVEGPG